MYTEFSHKILEYLTRMVTSVHSTHTCIIILYYYHSCFVYLSCISFSTISTRHTQQHYFFSIIFIKLFFSFLIPLFFFRLFVLWTMYCKIFSSFLLSSQYSLSLYLRLYLTVYRAVVINIYLSHSKEIWFGVSRRLKCDKVTKILRFGSIHRLN